MKLFGNSELIPNRGYEAAKRGQRSPDRLPLGAKEECSRHLLLFSKQFLRDCLKIPDKPHCGLSRVLRTQPGTPFHRLACHQTQRLRTPLAIFQTVSLRTRVNKSEERKGRGTTPRPLLRCWGALGRLHTVAVGLMFWFTRKRLVGSYSFFMSTKRSKSSR